MKKPKFLRKDLGREIKRLREAGLFSDMSYEAKELGIARSVLVRIEKGLPVEWEYLFLVCRDYGINPAYYLTETQ